MSRIGRSPDPGARPASRSPSPTARSPSRAPGAPWRAPCPARSPSARRTRTLLVERPDDERQNRALHGLTRSLVNNMVVGVTDGFNKDLEIVGVGYRAIAQGRRTSSSWPSASATRSSSTPPTASPSRCPQPTRISGAGHRQGAGRPGGRQHPQDPQARALQGQGRPLRRRAGHPQGRQGREVGTELRYE